MDKERVKQFADKVFDDMAGAMTAGLGFVGVKTGLFHAMAGKPPMTTEELAGIEALDLVNCGQDEQRISFEPLAFYAVRA